MDWELVPSDQSDSETEKQHVNPKFSSYGNSGDCKDSSDSEELSPRQTSSFTTAMEDLKISDDQTPLNFKPRYQEPRNESLTAKNFITSPLRTRAQDTMTSYVMGQEVLWYQGNHHSAKEISPLFKKDCRMWLWKGQAKQTKKSIMADYLRR